MPILYSIITKETNVLAQCARCAGNFQEVTKPIIANILPQDDKLTYSHGNYFFHYICENGIIYMCIADKEFDRSRAFLFLGEIKRRFQESYEPTTLNEKFPRILANLMKHYSDSQDIDIISKVHREVEELKNIMVKNIDSAVARDEHLELVMEKTEKLNRGSRTFIQVTRDLERSVFWKKMKCYVIIGVVVTVLAYIIVTVSCGGFTWKNCIAK